MTLGQYLDLWARWMHIDEGTLDFPGVSGGFEQTLSNYRTAGDDSDVMAERREMSYGPIIDACINSLDAHEAWSVRYRYRLARALAFPRCDPRATFKACEPRLRALIAARLPLENDTNVVPIRQFDCST